MRWPYKNPRKWQRAFAVLPRIVDGQVIWWEPYERRLTMSDVVDVWEYRHAQRIEARSDETLQAARPEGQEPDGEADAPNPNQEQSQ